MLRLEQRPEPSKAMSIASPLLALAITVVIGTILFVLLGKDPLRGLAVFFVEPVKSAYALSELAMKATPLLLVALGADVPDVGAKADRQAEGDQQQRRRLHRQLGERVGAPHRLDEEDGEAAQRVLAEDQEQARADDDRDRERDQRRCD